MEILSLGEKIKRKRKELNMTLKDLAGERITPGQISLVESGKSNPSMDLLEYLAVNLNTTVEYLMETEETQAEKICEYYENIVQSYIFNEDYTLAVEYIEKALYYAERYNLEYKKAKNFYLRGLIYMQLGEIGPAQQLFLSANTIFIKNNCYEDMINTFIKLGIITINLNAYHSSCSYFQQAEKVFRDNDIGNEVLLGEIYYYIAYTYFKTDNIDKAISYSFLAKEKYRQLDEKEEYAKTLMLLTMEYSEKGDIDNAIKYSKKTLNIYRELNDAVYTAEIENSLGKLFYEFENFEESFIHFNKAKELRQKNNDNKLIETLVNICENYIKIKDVNGAKNVLQDISKQLVDINDKSMIKYYLLKYKVETLEGNSLDAENTLHEALNYAKNMEYLKEEAEISIIIGKHYMDCGNDNQAAQYLNSGVSIFKKVGLIKEF